MNNVRRTDSLGKNWKKQFLMTNKAKASKSKITSSHGKKNYTQNYKRSTTNNGLGSGSSTEEN